MNKKEKILTGITPKCLQLNGKAFVGATGELWPCCWLYSVRADLEEWAERNDCSMDDLNLTKYTVDQIQNSKLMTLFYKSFDTETCKRECGTTSWKNSLNTKRGEAVIT